MGIGEMKQIKLVQLLTTKGANGNWTAPVEGEKFGAWAEISNSSGFRDYQNGQTQLGSTKRFKVRFRFDKYPKADWKVIYDGKEWTISVREKVDEKRFYWLITAQAKSDV
jgi:SPP1 family predicted phage head-tail adaptor